MKTLLRSQISKDALSTLEQKVRAFSRQFADFMQIESAETSRRNSVSSADYSTMTSGGSRASHSPHSFSTIRW
jgi:hypothetical protein